MPTPSQSLLAPRFFSAEERKLWRETVFAMEGKGTFDEALAPQVELYVAAIIRHRKIQRQLRRAKLGADGTLALCRLAGSTAGSVRSLAKALGLVPGKSKPVKKSASKWEGVL